jgi:hypothetical protein
MTIMKPFGVIPLGLGTITTGNEQASRPAIHLAQSRNIGMIWQTTGNTNVWVRCDLGAANPINFVSLISANALPGTTIRVRIGATQAEVDGTAFYDSGVLPFISPSIARTDGLYHSHLELSSVATKQWIRIDIAGHTGDFAASTLVVGKKLTPARFYSNGFEYRIQDLGSLDFTRWGVADTQDGRKLRELRFTLGWQGEAEYQDVFRPALEQLGTTGIIYWCHDPDPNTWRQAKTYLGKFNQSPGAVAATKPMTFAIDYSILSMI